MINWLDNLTILQFIVFVVVSFLWLIQLALLGRLVTKGAPASLITGILAAVGTIVLFAWTR